MPRRRMPFRLTAFAFLLHARSPKPLNLPQPAVEPVPLTNVRLAFDALFWPRGEDAYRNDHNRVRTSRGLLGMFVSGWRRTAASGHVIPPAGHGPDLRLRHAGRVEVRRLPRQRTSTPTPTRRPRGRSC